MWRLVVLHLGLFQVQTLLHDPFSTYAVAGVPAQLYHLLSDQHTLLHVLYAAHTQFQLAASEAGFDTGRCWIANYMALLLASRGYVQIASQTAGKELSLVVNALARAHQLGKLTSAAYLLCLADSLKQVL
jgi:hypothetical protein